jgi:dipeptidyl aminopeptidase/acylaminoacyl peptidase
MLQDIRHTDEARAVGRFYEALFAPGTGHVYSASEPVASPDGETAWFTGLSFPGALEAGPRPGVYRVDLASGVFAPVHDGAARVPRPSPDGRRLAFVTPGAAGRGDRLLITEPDGSGPLTMVEPRGVIEQVAWSPSGRQLLMVVAGLGADLAGFQGGYALAGVAEGPDWLPEVSTGEEEDLWRSLWVLDADGEGLRSVSRAGSNVWEASWCGEDAVAVVRSNHHGEGSWYSSTLALIDVASGAEQELYAPTDQIGLPGGSPDASRVVFVEAVASDRGLICGILKHVSTKGGAPLSVDTGTTEITSVAWRDAKTVHVAGQAAFETVVADVDIETGQMTELWRTEEATCGDWYPNSAPLAGGRSLVAAEAYRSAPALTVLGHNGATQVVSFAGPNAEAAMAACGTTEPVRWQAPDGLEMHGWLMRPEGVTGPTPLVLDIHGGPVWANRNRWVARTRATPLLIEKGCSVLYANPRGSSTRGQDFARKVKGDMGGDDTGDFTSALDHFVAVGIADPDRLATTGSSYGGFMSAWLVTQYTSLAAAAPISPVSNWYSQHYSSQIPFFDEIFLNDDPSNPTGRYFERSPAFHAQNARTPCLIMAGALDKNTPPGQAVEFRQALVERGVENALVIYPKDGHSLRGYPAYLDSAARILIWFGKYLRL